jgi:transcriptional regulator with XRE-family HTH domain
MTLKFLNDKFSAAVQAAPMGVREIAAVSGVSKSAIYQYMSGDDTPGSEALAAVCAALREPMEHFFSPDCPAQRTDDVSVTGKDTPDAT